MEKLVAGAVLPCLAFGLPTAAAPRNGGLRRRTRAIRERS